MQVPEKPNDSEPLRRQIRHFGALLSSGGLSGSPECLSRRSFRQGQRIAAPPARRVSDRLVSEVPVCVSDLNCHPPGEPQAARVAPDPDEAILAGRDGEIFLLWGIRDHREHVRAFPVYIGMYLNAHCGFACT